MSSATEYTWTKEEIVETLTRLAKRHLDMTFEQFATAVKEDKLDTCEYGEMIGLLYLLPEYEPVTTAA